MGFEYEKWLEQRCENFNNCSYYRPDCLCDNKKISKEHCEHYENY